MNALKDFVAKQLAESAETKARLAADAGLRAQIEKICQVVIEAYKKGNKTLFAGNGGSAADAQHFAAEFVSRFYFDRPGLPSIALTTDTSALTAIGNDYGYERLFSRQVEALGRPGDVLVVMSTSGKSPNILAALKQAKKMGLITIGLTGSKGDMLAAACDHCIKAPHDSTPRIQECHGLIGHILCASVEEALFGASKS